jgi:hypothetical protein
VRRIQRISKGRGTAPESCGGNTPLNLLVQNFGTVESHEIHYPGGLRYPHLERIPGTHDYLCEIFEPRSDKVRQNNASNSR